MHEQISSLLQVLLKVPNVLNQYEEDNERFLKNHHSYKCNRRSKTKTIRNSIHEFMKQQNNLKKKQKLCAMRNYCLVVNW